MDTPVSGTPRVLLRVEGLAVLIGAVVGYQASGASWALFVVLLLVPDLGLLGYLLGPRPGAVAYNAVHTYLGPFVVAVIAYAYPAPAAWPVCLIWIAHIGMDRALGLGLKFPSAFGHTHLGMVGSAKPAA